MEYELSRPVIVDELPSRGRKIDLRPTSEELSAIATRLGLVSISQCEGTVSIRPEMGREIVADGEITASFVQTCVITGEPVAQSMTFPLSRRYSEDTSAFDDHDDDDIITDPMDDGPDPIENGIIDVGEAVVEELTLQIPAYPRAPGAEFSDIVDDTDGDNDKPNPFAKLAALKNNLKTKS